MTPGNVLRLTHNVLKKPGIAPSALRCRAGLVLCVAVTWLAAALSAAAAESSAPIDPARVGWTNLEFSASKLWLSAQASLGVTRRLRDIIAARLVNPLAGNPVPPPPEVLEITYGARGMGRLSDTTLWLDPASTAAVQRMQLDGGSRKRQRVYRYTDIGAWHETRWPADRREAELPPENWTERTSGLRAYPPAAAGLAITDATALLYLVAAADLRKAGDRSEFFTFSRRRVHRVAVTVSGKVETRADYEESTAGSQRRRQGRIEALRLVIRGSPLHEAGGENEQFELLGLQGDIELLLEPASRAPLELRGRARMIGEVTFHLRHARLR